MIIKNSEDYNKKSIFIPFYGELICELRKPFYQRFKEIIPL